MFHKKNFICQGEYLLLAFILTICSNAQDYRLISPDKPLLKEKPIEKAENVQQTVNELVDKLNLPAQPNEEIIINRLKGIVLLENESQFREGGNPDIKGIDTSEITIPNEDGLRQLLKAFLNKPVSFESLNRIRLLIRQNLSQVGYPYSLVYTPPQDITSGVIQFYVKPSKIEKEVQVEGAKYFSKKQYSKGMRIDYDGPINKDQLNKDAAWLSKNPFRQVVVITEAGKTRGTTTLTLQTKETRPYKFNTGIENTGTENSDENRLKFGVNLGNAFGRGDLLDYQYRADPEFRFSSSHSANYTTFLPWYHQLTVFGAYSKVESDLEAPLDQTGSSYQLGARYQIPLKDRNKLKHSITYGLDFKSSDNTLAISNQPVFDRLTHVIQGSVSYAGGIQDGNGQMNFDAGLFFSPGDIGSNNGNEAFNASRAGANPKYVYLTAGFDYYTKIPKGLTYRITARGQISSTNLLGSEQIGGSGVAAVRGYEESELFGDHGIVLRNELLFKPLSPSSLFGVENPLDQLQSYVFTDFAILGSHSPLTNEPSSIKLASVGLGFNYNYGDHASLNASYGWQLADSGNSLTGDSGRLHLGLQITF